MVSSTKQPNNQLAEPLLTHFAEILADVDTQEVSPELGDLSKPVNDIFKNNRSKWNNDVNQSRCNFEYQIKMNRHAGLYYYSIWKKSTFGRTLVEIKADDNEVPHFAKEVSTLILEIVGENISLGDWALVTSPRRRHKTRNFADLICKGISDILQIPYIQDIAIAKNKDRIGAEFELAICPKQQNLIVFDDFVTTGSTFAAMRKILAEKGKTMLFFTGINNNK